MEEQINTETKIKHLFKGVNLDKHPEYFNYFKDKNFSKWVIKKVQEEIAEIEKKEVENVQNISQ